MTHETVDTAPMRPAAPYSRHFKPVERTCPECNQPFQAVNRTRLFCRPEHKLAFHNRCAARGKVLIPLAMAWRTKRGSGDTAKRAMSEMCRLLDSFAAEDRAAGRMGMTDYVGRGFVHGHRSWRACGLSPRRVFTHSCKRTSLARISPPTLNVSSAQGSASRP